MEGSYPIFLSEAAERLRELAYVAPEIANELRRFAEELEASALGAGLREWDGPDW